jgi:hypothetical protein
MLTVYVVVTQPNSFKPKTIDRSNCRTITIEFNILKEISPLNFPSVSFEMLIICSDLITETNAELWKLC